MRMIETLKNFRDDEEGAVTVDWVVLTAGIVGLAIVVVTTVADGVYDLADRIAHVLGSHIHPT